MAFFAESLKKQNSGVFGFEISLVAEGLQLTSEIRELVLPFKARCGQIETAFNLYFISTKSSPLGVFVHCHGHIDGDRLAHFVLHLQRKPIASPPTQVAQINEKLGGYIPGYLNFLSKMGEQQAQFRASFEGLILKPKQWQLKITRQKIPKKIGAFAFEETKMQFENRRHKTKMIATFKPGANPYLIQIDSTISLRINENCFESACEQLLKKVSSLFLKNEKPH